MSTIIAFECELVPSLWDTRQCFPQSFSGLALLQLWPLEVNHSHTSVTAEPCFDNTCFSMGKSVPCQVMQTQKLWGNHEKSEKYSPTSVTVNLNVMRVTVYALALYLNNMPESIPISHTMTKTK